MHAFEARLVEVLARRRPELVTEVVAADEDGRMLMRDAGPQLYAVLERDLDVRYWEKALPLYAELQIALMTDAREMLAAGAFDRRTSVLARIYDELLAEPAEGLSAEEYERLRLLEPEVRRVAKELAAGPVDETINNDDFTDGSIHMDGGRYRFLDWGDACVSHPFFTATVTLRVIERRHGLPPRSSGIERVRDAYLEPFTRFASRTELTPLFDDARRFGQICRAALQAEASWEQEPGEFAWSLRLILEPEAWRDAM